MAADGNTTYSDLCRLCATKTNMILAINIFENEGAMREITKKIETCLPIQVHETDQLPKMICENCLYKLELFFDFRERSLRTENILITLLKEINKEVSIPLETTANMIMIQQPLLEQQIQNEIDLSQLQQRDLIVEQEIILSQSNVDMSPHLGNIDLNHEEAILVDHKDVRYPDENLLIQQEQLLTDQYRLHITDNSVDDIIAENSSSDIQDSIICKEEFEIIKTETFKETFTPVLVGNENGSSVSGMKSKDDEWFHCNMCGRSFKDKNEFQTHYEDHFNKCAACLAVFTNREALNEHRKEMHRSTVEETKPIKTRLKRATVPLKKQNGIKSGSNSDSDGNQENLDDDDDEDDPEEVIESPTNRRKKWSLKECKECGKTYKTNYKLAEHMRKHTGEKPYKCGSCEKAFRSKIGLAQHEAKHTGQYDLSCPTCGKGFQCKSYLMVHQRVHSDVKPYPCTTCGRNFKTKQSLLDHTNRHLGVKPYMCDVCGRGFITKGLCKAHQKVHTGLDNRKYSCKVCNKMFVSKSYLQTHLRIHTGEKPFICEVCGKGFLTRVDLKIHTTMHTGEKSYVCEMCGKAFARRDALRCHRRSHTGERPYSCDQCGQTFTQFSPMAIHKRLHTGERPYSCEVCGQTFVSRSTMVSHSKRHVR
ncbi:hypothetical protein RN001_015127 [Aquatica leii]|uniref:Uncharacterized protein n=1 Tax=Aquatica leii TaxID=1421715 RepID=A0AAN7P1D9_9COLE|nr:hypothetical protein RN001_015127 [Aquatica leii]